jgi:hypothetical protein
VRGGPLTIATKTMGDRRLAPGVLESGRVVMARTLLSIPTMAKEWRKTAAEFRKLGQADRASSIERCAMEIERVVRR